MDTQLPQVELIASTAQGSISSFPFAESMDAGLFVNASMNIAGIEVNTVDVALLVLCPILATLGVLVSSMIYVKQNHSQEPFFKRIFTGLFSNFANLFIGIVVGLVIALFFVGAINNDITSLTRVLVLTVFLGYKAPLFWSKTMATQELPKSIKAKTQASAVLMNQDALKQDALKQQRLKRAKLKVAGKG
ncbi:MAG: hypothetical protein HRU06_01290 [Oceanospirillaceae bacterium]|nr:hypothetical protein [Oceanospirillaceae bacterium]